MKPSVVKGEVPLTNSFENDRWLLQEDTLRKWGHLTLEQRCAKIEKLFRVKRAKRTLYCWYKHRRVIWRKTHMGFRSEVTDVHLLEKRRTFASKLHAFIKAGRPILYCDESSHNCW